MKQLQSSRSLAAVYFFVCLAIFACVSSFYRLNSYLSTDTSITDSSTLSLSLPDGNCSCTVACLSSPSAGTGHSEPAKVRPALSCNCNKSTVDMRLQRGYGKVKLGCPVCPSMHTVETVEVAKPWNAEGKEWHFPPKFPLCSMDACFNYSRCDNMAEPLVYTYDLPSPPQRYFERIKETKYWTGDPEKACLFSVFLDTQLPWPVWPKDLPHWNGGLNHVLITFEENWETRNPPSDSIGNASILGTIVYQTTYRAGFDISIPLPGKAHVTALQFVHPLQRKYFATFRGTRYLGETGDGVFRSSDSFRGMHNGEDVVVATSSSHGTKERPHLDVNCDEDGEYDFSDLMNTTFGLVSAGRRPASFRLIEVLSAGAVPVLIADNYVKPFDTVFHWHECLLQFPTSQMARLVPALRALRTEDIVKRQANCVRIYNEFLKDDATLLDASMRAVKERFMGVISSFVNV